ncbi:hypothetical protein AB1Y20_006172 [Prymnesium parvum]|uniref:Uncharacterized protein n=1 Tax=Prymnesium parvum TaxID=97485 RepID=A0AB34J418_PRYPA
MLEEILPDGTWVPLQPSAPATEVPIRIIDLLDLQNKSRSLCEQPVPSENHSPPQRNHTRLLKWHPPPAYDSSAWALARMKWPLALVDKSDHLPIDEDDVPPPPQRSERKRYGEWQAPGAGENALKRMRSDTAGMLDGHAGLVDCELNVVAKRKWEDDAHATPDSPATTCGETKELTTGTNGPKRIRLGAASEPVHLPELDDWRLDAAPMQKKCASFHSRKGKRRLEEADIENIEQNLQRLDLLSHVKVPRVSAVA